VSEKKSSVGMIIGVVAVVGCLCLCCVSICAAGGMYYVIYASQPDPWDYDWGTEWSSGWEDTYTPTASTDPRLADLRGKMGSWIGDYNIDFNSSQPTQFTHYFLVFNGSSGYVSPGAIVVGENWDYSSAPMWRVVYGHTLDDGRWYIGADGLTYLGKDWDGSWTANADILYEEIGEKTLPMMDNRP
jgi:hypothetical protein